MLHWPSEVNYPHSVPHFSFQLYFKGKGTRLIMPCDIMKNKKCILLFIYLLHIKFRIRKEKEIVAFAFTIGVVINFSSLWELFFFKKMSKSLPQCNITCRYGGVV